MILFAGVFVCWYACSNKLRRAYIGNVGNSNNGSNNGNSGNSNNSNGISSANGAGGAASECVETTPATNLSAVLCAHALLENEHATAPCDGGALLLGISESHLQFIDALHKKVGDDC